MGTKGGILLSILISTHYVICEECPIGWRYNATFSKCYLFTNEIATWNSVREECQRFNGKLVEILSEDENNWLDDQLSEYSNTVLQRAWIGYVDSDSDGDFEWLSGSKSTYTSMI
ncbi:NKG2-D type II integral membrane protein-like [Antedon mediterranea]|uniref:NKG2-D type II integral membrane protein-like n=1 Tax=Antedon mediterranea TaxID=105859 RepID=UPI003AF84062